MHLTNIQFLGTPCYSSLPRSYYEEHLNERADRLRVHLGVSMKPGRTILWMHRLQHLLRTRQLIMLEDTILQVQDRCGL